MPLSKFVKAAIVAGCLFAAAALTACVLAGTYPAFDIVSNGLPLLAAGLLVLVLASLVLRSSMLIVTSAALLAVTLAILIPRLSGAAPQAPDGSERLLRIATFNMWGKGDLHLRKVEKFLASTDPDAVVLEEIRWKHGDFLRYLKTLYPYQAGSHGLVILSKHPILKSGRLDRENQPYWRSLIVHWALLDVNGTEVKLVGAHMARPFYPAQQKSDIDTLTAFVRSQTGPIIVAGDLNMTPWTQKLHKFTAETGMRRFNTLVPTWPARWKDLPLLPLLPIDHVFVSPHLAKIDVRIGPRLESDHLPVVADIALAK